MRVHLGIGVAQSPSLRTLGERLRQHAESLAARNPELDFLRNDDRLLDVPILIENGLYIAEIAVPLDTDQPPLLAPPRRPRRAASLREDESARHQPCVDQFLASMHAGTEAEEQLVRVLNTATAAELPGAVRELERRTGLNAAVLRREMIGRCEPFVVELPGQVEFDFPVPPAVRRTVVSEHQVAVHIKPSPRATVDLPAEVTGKLAIYDRTPIENPAERTPDELFEVSRTYGFRFINPTAEQRAVIMGAWCLGLDVSVLARYATSTTTLKAAPAEVDAVIGWSGLAQAVAAAAAAAVDNPYTLGRVGRTVDEPETSSEV